jgi:alpha-beta hydrolase superfamily lysophospholipase
MSWLGETGLHGESLFAQNCSAVLLIVHGIGEHGGRYEAAMRHLATRGVGCFVYDQRGHGRSPGPRGDVERFQLLVEDANEIATRIHQEHPGLPFFLWGHSMGSLVVLLAVGSIAGKLRGVTTSGCPLDAYARTMRWFLPPMRQLARATPRLRISGLFSPADLSHEPTVQRAYEEDPLVGRSVTLRLATGIATACNEARTAAPSVKVPWLAVHGDEDRIAPPSGSQHLMQLLGSEDKRLIRYAGLRHEIHNETEPHRTQFLETMAQWIGDHT